LICIWLQTPFYITLDWHVLRWETLTSSSPLETIFDCLIRNSARNYNGLSTYCFSSTLPSPNLSLSFFCIIIILYFLIVLHLILLDVEGQEKEKILERLWQKRGVEQRKSRWLGPMRFKVQVRRTREKLGHPLRQHNLQSRKCLALENIHQSLFEQKA
jgi:hypothetical protein